jgi:8-oxo-dGTP pyrophosphatase MutT (NUDIX family)
MSRTNIVPKNNFTHFRNAAVMVLMDEKNRLILTKRTSHVKTHKGQISFPGGKQEKQDASLLDTALRETFEEIGINPGKVTGLRNLCPSFSPRGFYIYPYFGKIRNAGFSKNPGEVERILKVPIDFFLKNPPKKHYYNILGVRLRADFYQFGPHLIWGATARIITDFVHNFYRTPRRTLFCSTLG